MEILFIQIGGFTLQEKGKDFFAMLAERDHTTVEKIKEKISKRIWEGLHDPDPERRVQWERIPCAGDVPTPEEWLRYSVERLKTAPANTLCCVCALFSIRFVCIKVCPLICAGDAE